MNAEEEPLVEARVDLARLGSNWRVGLVQLIEAHECKYDYLATRRMKHALMDRYAARYFYGDLSNDDRRFVLQLLSARYRARRDKHLSRLFKRATVRSGGVVEAAE